LELFDLLLEMLTPVFMQRLDLHRTLLKSTLSLPSLYNLATSATVAA
jgi:hypothetical protein